MLLPDMIKSELLYICYVTVSSKFNWGQKGQSIWKLFNKLHKFGKLVKINIFAPSGRCSNSHKRSIFETFYFKLKNFTNLLFVPLHGHYCNYFDILNNLDKLEVVLKFIGKIFKL